MTSGGWEWRADRERWVAHAPVSSGLAVLGLVGVAGQLLMMIMAPDDALIREHRWLVIPWIAVVVPVAVHLIWPPERVTPRWTQRAWARLHRRPSPRLTER